MIGDDIREARVEPLKRIETPELCSGRDKMKVADMDEFHAGLLCFVSPNRDSRSNPAASTIG